MRWTVSSGVQYEISMGISIIVIMKNELILTMYVHSRTNKNLIAGRFSLIGLCQLCAKHFVHRKMK